MAFEREGLFDRYLRTVATELRLVEPGRREAALAELRAHLADAAAAEGRDPDEPAFQAEQIAHLGPARRVGRELAVANGADPRTPLWLRALGGVGVLLAPVMLVAGFSAQDEDFGEFLIVGSQMAFVFAVPAVYAILRHRLPRLSLAHLIVGLLAGLPLPLSAVISYFAPGATFSPPLPDLVIFLWVALSGVWVTLTGALAVLRAGRLHPHARERDGLLGPALIGLLSGPAWIVMFTAGVLGGMEAGGPPMLRGIATFALYGWMIFNTLWCLAMAVWLLLPASWHADPEVPVTEASRPRL